MLLDAEWKAVEGSKYFGTPYLYKENGFKEREKAEELIAYLKEEPPLEAKVLFFITLRNFRMTVPKCLK